MISAFDEMLLPFFILAASLSLNELVDSPSAVDVERCLPPVVRIDGSSSAVASSNAKPSRLSRSVRRRTVEYSLRLMDTSATSSPKLSSSSSSR